MTVHLWSDDVYAVLRYHADVPLTTREVAHHTRSTYPVHADVTTDRIRDLLWYLVRRKLVVSYPHHDVDSLAKRGITTAQKYSRYWALPGGA